MSELNQSSVCIVTPETTGIAHSNSYSTKIQNQLGSAVTMQCTH